MSTLQNIPGSVSHNAAFILLFGKELCYVVKTEIHMVSGKRLNPHDPAIPMDYLLRTHAEWDGREWVCTLRKEDCLHLYSEMDIEVFKQLNRNHFASGLFRIVDKAEMEKLNGTRMYPGKSLGQGRL